MNQPIALCCTYGDIPSIEKAYSILEQGGSAVEAVVSLIEMVELDPNVHDVGYNGFPNILGEAELDASIMVGNTRKSGSVVGIKHYRNPIRLAAMVLERLPYDMLTGESAEKFAQILGLQPHESMYDEEIRGAYEDFIKNRTFDFVEGEHANVRGFKKEGFLSYVINNKNLFDLYDEFIINHHGTVDAIALDQQGQLVSGVSTSGLAFRMPGRVSDSARIGAGNYASEFGGAGCTGVGELTVALGLTKVAVSLLETHDVSHATYEAIEQANRFMIQQNRQGPLNIIAMTREGKVAGCSNTGGERSFLFRSNKVSEPQFIPFQQNRNGITMGF
jgi:L-asparaginase / beta-aspartyl-peptidase